MRLTKFLNEIQILTELKRKFKPEFLRSFQGSKVVEDDGTPQMVFHGTTTPNEIQEFYPLSHFGSIEAAEKILRNKGRVDINSRTDKLTKQYMDGLMAQWDREGKEASREEWTKLGTEFRYETSQQLEKELGEFSSGARVIPVYLDIKNPLELKDRGHTHSPWNWLSDINDELKVPWEEQEEVTQRMTTLRDNYIKSQGEEPNYATMELGAAQRSLDAGHAAMKKAVEEYLKSKGYDGVVYTNRVEAKGSKSWVPLDNSQIIPSTTAVINESTLNELMLPKRPEFYQWFKGSKVIDDEGNPLPVFHGTESKTQFDTPRPWSHFGTSGAAGDRLHHIYTTMQLDTGTITPTRIMPFYLNIKNPLQIDDPNDQHDIDLWMSLLWNTGKFKNLRRLEVAAMNGDERFYQEATSFLLAHGYDGLWYYNTSEDPGSVSWVPIHGDQIRTAITENINETIKGEWGGGWHNIQTGEDIYEEEMPHYPLAHKNKEKFGVEAVKQLGRLDYNSVYEKGWIRYFWAFEKNESYMEFTANDDGLKRGLSWIMDTGKKYNIEKIRVSNRYSEDYDNAPKEELLYLVDEKYVPKDQAPEEVVSKKTYW